MQFNKKNAREGEDATRDVGTTASPSPPFLSPSSLLFPPSSPLHRSSLTSPQFSPHSPLPASSPLPFRPPTHPPTPPHPPPSHPSLSTRLLLPFPSSVPSSFLLPRFSSFLPLFPSHTRSSTPAFDCWRFDLSCVSPVCCSWGVALPPQKERQRTHNSRT